MGRLGTASLRNEREKRKMERNGWKPYVIEGKRVLRN